MHLANYFNWLRALVPPRPLVFAPIKPPADLLELVVDLYACMHTTLNDMLNETVGG